MHRTSSRCGAIDTFAGPTHLKQPLACPNKMPSGEIWSSSIDFGLESRCRSTQQRQGGPQPPGPCHPSRQTATWQFSFDSRAKSLGKEGSSFTKTCIGSDKLLKSPCIINIIALYNQQDHRDGVVLRASTDALLSRLPRKLRRRRRLQLLSAARSGSSASSLRSLPPRWSRSRRGSPGQVASGRSSWSAWPPRSSTPSARKTSRGDLWSRSKAIGRTHPTINIIYMCILYTYYIYS